MVLASGSQLAFLRDVPNTTTFTSRQRTVNTSTGRALSGLVNLFRRSHSPPEVGAAEAKSAMAMPVARMKMLAWNQPEGVSTTAIIDSFKNTPRTPRVIEGPPLFVMA